ncbi:MAG: hypothetical protein AAB734_03670, partial [Patescibacteria group bacterium]
MNIISKTVFSGAVFLLLIPTLLIALEVGRDTVRATGDEIRSEMTTRGPAVAEEIIVQYAGEGSFRIEKLGRGVSVEAGARAAGFALDAAGKT